jgi:hypothetical protein
MADEIEEPQWRLIANLNKVEVRQYAPSIQAVTQLGGAGDSSEGFRRLAGYIFGGNERSQSIAMTAPVQETLEQSGPTMAFTLPAEYDFEDLPAPDSEQVTLVPVPGRIVAAIRFSGWATDGKVASMRQELLAVLDRNGIATVGVPTLNQYNPPWTLPFLRRNEIAVEIQWSSEIPGID